MASKAAQIKALVGGDDTASWISNLWDTYNNQRAEWLAQKRELRDYIFATDTTTTTNSSLPWKNSTTMPKLCQIRDNLHSNYLSAIFPNESWLQWESFSQEAASKEKSQIIEEYMAVKCRRSGYRNVISQALYDYIDYGNAFLTASFEARYKKNLVGDKVVDYVGPIAERISPLDIVFDPTCKRFEDSFKIIRTIKTLGELASLSISSPDARFWADYIASRVSLRKAAGGFSKSDFDKACGYSVDGFGSYYEYLQSEYVEVLEYYGNVFDSETGELHLDRMITVVDRCKVVRDTDIPTYSGKPPIRHVGWRLRQDNLWAMGPLDNLVGMQYRIDHLENLKADAADLIVHPPLKIRGDVEQFTWGPNCEIHIDENGDVSEVSKSLAGLIQATNDIQMLEEKMELYAGAPREAMGIRSAGEKTAFEVSQLTAAAGRIFQEKVTTFELLLLEPNLNDMLEQAHRNMGEAEALRVFDSELEVKVFQEITRDDLVGDGVLHPVGARHFAEQSKFVQDIANLSNSNLANFIANHVSGKALSKALASALNVEKLGIFQPNIALEEAMETQRLQASLQEQLEVEASQNPPEV